MIDLNLFIACPGPDGFGYICEQMAYPGLQPVITEAGPFSSPSSYVGPIDIGFPFSYYGNEYEEVYIASNGIITFSDPGVTPFGTENGGELPAGCDPNDCSETMYIFYISFFIQMFIYLGLLPTGLAYNLTFLEESTTGHLEMATVKNLWWNTVMCPWMSE